MKDIVSASEIYKMINGKYPPDCIQTLRQEGLLETKKSIMKNGNLNVFLKKMVQEEHYQLIALKK